METADRPAGNGDEHVGPDRLSLAAPGLAAVLQAVPEFGDLRMLHDQADHQGHGHEYQCYRKERVDFADDLVDGEHRGDNVIDEDYPRPDHEGGVGSVAGQVFQDDGRAVNEHGSHQHQQQDAEAEHHGPGAPAEVFPDQLRQARAAIAQRQHPAEIVMHGSAEDAAQHDPEVGRRAELRAHDGPEDGPRTGDVQELDHEDLPRGHGDEIDAVRLGDGGRGTRRVRTEHPLYELAVEQVSQDQCDDADEE